MQIAILLLLSLSFLYLFSQINGLNIEIENLQAVIMSYQSEQLILQEKILNCLSNIQENLVQMEARRVDSLRSQDFKFYVSTILVLFLVVTPIQTILSMLVE